MPRLQGMAWSKALGCDNLPPDRCRTVYLVGTDQLLGTLERGPRFTMDASTLCQPLLSWGITIDKLSKSIGRAGTFPETTHG